MLARVATFCIDGLDSRPVTVEVDIRPGLPAFTIVGLGDTAVREARERARAALLNSGFEFPMRRIVANLAPAHVRKAGSGFDLAIACAVVAASRQLPVAALADVAVYGELSLTGELRGCRGTLAVAEAARRAGLRRLVVPRSRAGEAGLVDELEIVAARTLREAIEVLAGADAPAPPVCPPDERSADASTELDLSDVRGHAGPIEAMRIAAAGGHNLLLRGSPGTGKTMLARRMPTILPPLTRAEAIEVTRIQSVTGLHRGDRLVDQRPFRAPHHTISASGLVGGGAWPAPGEATLAHPRLSVCSLNAQAGIYARISSDRDGDQLGVRRQIADCEAHAARRGWEVVDRYIDDDVSAYSGKARPEYERMLADMQCGLLDAIVVWHVDRLHRQPKELEQFIEACDAAGVRDLASVTGDIDLATHDGRFTARILGAVARKESDDKSRRIRRKMAELAMAGKSSGGGTRPFGYEADRETVCEPEAVVIRECAQRLLAGESLRSICNDLIDRQVPTVTGAEWKTQTLRRLLRSGRISGQREHRGELVADAQWPAIISKSDTARIRALLDDPSRRTNRTARRYLLTRLVRCELCGATLVARPRDDGRRRYICARGANFDGCGRLYIVADELEAHVVEAVLYRLDSPELADALNGADAAPDADRWQAEATEAAAQLDELARAWAEKAISMSEWLAARGPIEQRMRAARRQLAHHSRTAALDGHVGNASELRERWGSLPLTRQRAIVAAVVDHLVVGPGRRGYNRFDLTRVKPVWRV